MKAKVSWILLALPTVVAGLVLIVVLNWHLPTRIRIRLNADRIVFKIAGEEQAVILDSVGLRSVIIEKFESIKLRPETLTLVTGKEDSEVALNRRHVSSRLTINRQPVVITPKEERSQSNVTIIGAESVQHPLLLMDSIIANPGSEVTLEKTDDPENLIVRIDGQQSAGKITLAQPIEIQIDQCEVSGIRPDLRSGEPLNLGVKLVEGSSIEFNGRQDSLALVVGVPPEKATSLFPQGRIPVAAIRFEMLDVPSRKMLSSLSKSEPAEITYPDYQDSIDKISVTNPDFLSLDYLQDFNIEQLSYQPEQKGLSVTLYGVAGKVASGAADHARDQRLTVYNAIWHNHKIVALFVGLCWVAGTTAGFYKVFKGA